MIWPSLIALRHQRLADDAPAPVRLAEPVAHFRGHAFHVLLHDEANPAHGGAVDLDGKERLGPHFARPLDERRPVLARVRMRKPVAQVQPDLAVVRVQDQRRHVTTSP
jgi:hypothetical protein